MDGTLAPLKRAARALPLLLAAAVMHAWPLPAHMSTHVPGDQRDPLLNAGILDHVMRSLATLRWGSLWETPFFHGQAGSLAFSESLLGTAWYGVPLWLLSPDPVWLHNAMHVAGLFFSAASALLLCTVMTGSASAGLVGAVVYAFSPFQAAHANHVQMHQAWALPLMFLGLWWVAHGTRQRGTGWTLAAAALAGQVLSCSYLGLYGAVAALPVVLVVAAMRGPLLWREDARGILLGVLVLLLMLLPTMLPYVRVADDLGFRRFIDEVRGFSQSPASMLLEPSNLLLHTPGVRINTNPEATTWPGRVAPMVIVVAWVAAAWRRRRRDALLLGGCVALVALCAWMSAGPGPQSGVSPWFAYSWLYHLVPGFNGLRVPPRFMGVAFLFMGVGAAVAVSLLRERLPRAAAPVALFLALACALDTWPARTPIHALPDGGSAGPVLDALAAGDNPGPIVELPYRLYWRAAQNVLNTTRHHRATYNGYSGVEPPLSLALRYLLPSFPLSGTDQLVRALGVRALVLHRGPPRADPGERAPFLEEMLARGELPGGFAVAMNRQEGAWLNVEPTGDGPLRDLSRAWSVDVRGCVAPGPRAVARMDIPVAQVVVSPVVRHRVDVEGARGRRVEVPPVAWPGTWVGALALEDVGEGPVTVAPRGAAPVTLTRVNATGEPMAVSLRATLPATLRSAQGLWFRVEVDVGSGVVCAGHEVTLAVRGIPGAEVRPTRLPLRTDAAPGCPGVAENVVEFLRGAGTGTLELQLRSPAGVVLARTEIALVLAP